MASSKIIVYQVFTRLYGNRRSTNKPNGTIQENGCGKLNDFKPTVLRKIRELGVTHLWFTGIIRHATTTDYSQYGIPRQHPAVVKGKAGSPYAIADYYDIDPDLAVKVDRRMEEFEKLVSRTHRAGLKMIIDFVPNHVARQYKSICKPKGVKDLGEGDNVQCGFDPAHNNFYYCPGEAFSPYFDLYHGEQEPYKEEPAKATGNDCFCNAPGMNDWYETVKLNYGVDYYAGGTGHFDPMPDTWKKMTDILLFWASKGVDAFRCDMAEMVPAAFWSYATGEVKVRYPEVQFIGEVYNPNEYRNYIAAGFDYLYDKVGMYDVLRDIVCHRRGTGDITHAWQHTDDIRQHMLYFLENHDEQRIASDFFAGDGFKAVPALIVAALLERNPFMLYAGQEYGERGMDEEGFSGRDGRTTIFDYWSVDTLTRAMEGRLTDEELSLARIYNKVLAIAQKEKAVTEGEMFDLMYANQQYGAQYAFLRSNGKSVLLVAVSFDDTAAEIHLTIPAHAFDYLGIEEADYTAKDLLTDKELPLSMKRDGQVTVTLQPRGGVVCKF
jgi:glycosidase